MAEEADLRLGRQLPRGVFRLIVWDLLKTGKHSDMAIKLSDGTEIRCHRSIVCSQCAFFDNALEPGRFKESFTGVIELYNDPPQAVRALIEYLYTKKYPLEAPSDPADEALLHADVIGLAQMYNLPVLKKTADYFLLMLVRHNWNAAIIPVIPDLTRSLIAHDPFQEGIWFISLRAAIWRNGDTIVDDDEVWDTLYKEVPELMELMTRSCAKRWDSDQQSMTNRWLERVGGERERRLVGG